MYLLTRITVMALLVLLGYSTSEGVSSDVGRDQVARRPLISFIGPDTQILKQQHLRVTTRDAWIQLWLRHNGKAASGEGSDQYRPPGIPEIDFDQCMVIAITERPGQLNAGVAAVGIIESDREIAFDYDVVLYQSPKGAPTTGNAYGYFVLPRSKKPIVLRRNMQDNGSRLTAGPAIWKEVATFQALDAIKPRTDPHAPVSLNIVFAHDPGTGRYDGVVGQSSDNWNFVNVGATNAENLVSSQGTATPVKLSITKNDGEWGIMEHSGVFHGYIYDNCRCVDLQATFTGMPPGRYKVYVFAHGDAPNQNSDIELFAGGETFPAKSTLNDGTWDFRSSELVEGNQYVSFEFDVLNDEPVRITSRRSGSAYSMFNAIQIIPVSSPRHHR